MSFSFVGGFLAGSLWGLLTAILADRYARHRITRAAQETPADTQTERLNEEEERERRAKQERERQRQFDMMMKYTGERQV